ncbi:nuclear export factor GLE1 [Nitrobacter hamburgensis X14]|uniref:Nuclear export factor GLE1 n=1 Tax=Nitrobacter hamburgensis (strain DSM 10229 / NCIMB 13809 / X14) TaxID=323097 RepID=Q1QLA6_NITHX|nr:YcnI family protein [Nitrobacter hamburgensis]ABE62991.1 nuclear export factor GLE1 [Nitrobacter hamburgensis X14]
MTRDSRLWIGTVIAAVAAVASCNAARAHVTVQPADAPANSYAHLVFTAPHGCNGSATTALRIKLPEGILSAKPQMKPGWNVEIKSRKLEAPVQGPHGKSITDVVDEVAWRGGPLPDNLYDTFGLIVRLPDKPGQSLYFPVVQECEQGVERWIEIPSAGQGSDNLRAPAPAVHLKAKH